LLSNTSGDFIDKKILYIGLAMLAIAMLVLILNLSNTANITSGFSNVLVAQNITVPSDGFAPLVLNASNMSYFFIIAALNKPANIYLLNASGYSAWKTRASSNRTGLAEAILLEGRGAFAVYANAVNVTIPPSVGLSSTPLYILNKSGFYPAGKYYFIVDNTNGSASAGSPIQEKVVYLPPLTNSSMATGAFSSLGSQIAQEVIYGVIFFVLLVAGIVMLLYGYFKKPKNAQPDHPVSAKLPTNADQAYVDRLYKNIEKSKKAKKKKA
jgi:hypothetical protein